MKELIASQIEDAISLHTNVLESFCDDIDGLAKSCCTTLENGGKIIVAGNGGSGADSEHFAAELVGSFMKKDRKGLAAIALSSSNSVASSIANDFSYDFIFSRQIEALGNEGDLFIGISTSGNSANILKALEKAKLMKLNTFCLLGKDGGKCIGTADKEIVVKSSSTPRIQEIHMLILHIVCDIIDQKFS